MNTEKQTKLAALRKQLKPRELKFAIAKSEGHTDAEAARRSGSKGKSPQALCTQCARMKARNPAILQYIDALGEADESAATLSRQRKREILKEVAEAWKPSGRVKGDRVAAVAAIKTDNSMTGDDAPVRLEGELTLKGILQAISGTTGLPMDDREDI